MPRPARLISKLSIDIAERNGALLRRWLRSAERLSDNATARAVRLVKTPCSRSRASLARITRADHRRRAGAIVGPQQRLCLDGSFCPLFGAQCGAYGGDQAVGVERLV